VAIITEQTRGARRAGRWIAIAGTALAVSAGWLWLMLAGPVNLAAGPPEDSLPMLNPHGDLIFRAQGPCHARIAIAWIERKVVALSCSTTQSYKA